jgi:hypothetical protein
MNFVINTIGVSFDALIVDDAGLPVTGLLAATFPPPIWSLAGANADTAFPGLSDLATITSAWAAGGVKERGGGRYRLDGPNAMFTVLGKVTVRGEAAGKHLLLPTLEINGSSSDPLANVLGAYPSNTAGGVLQQISSTPITYVGPVDPVTGNAKVIIGDDYKAADGRALDWTNSAGTWPDLTAATIRFLYSANGLAAGNFAGSVVTPTGAGQRVRLELNAGQTGGMAPTIAGPTRFAVVATQPDGDSITIVRGLLTICTRP